MRVYDILAKQRLIAAGTIAGLSLAAFNACGNNGRISQEVEETIEANYDPAFVNDNDTVCYQEDLDHSSVSADLVAAIKHRPWLDIDTFAADVPEVSEKIDETLEALHEEAGHPMSATGNYPAQPGDTYSFCVNGRTDSLGAGDPVDFTVTHD